VWSAVFSRARVDRGCVCSPRAWATDKSVQQGLFAPRNRECLWRLANIAEHKQPDED
jgi:hypothetical protein